jgi:hypothetical protein
MITTMEPTVTLATNECECQYYNDEDELVQPDNCMGLCYEDACDWFGENALEFIEANNLTDRDYLLIEGSGMGWTRASGYKLIKAEINTIRESLMLNGDFRIEFYFSDDKKTLTARRWSHDEPMGTGLFTYKRVDVCAYTDCLAMDDLQDYKDEKYCPFCYEIAQANW